MLMHINVYTNQLCCTINQRNWGWAKRHVLPHLNVSPHPIAQVHFGATPVARLGQLIRTDVRFRPTFSAFDSLMFGWTPVLTLSVMLLLPAVYRCRYAMQRDVYATPSSGDRTGISSILDTPKMSFSSCYNKWSFRYFGISWIFSWNFKDTFWGHPRPILHLVKRGIIGAF